MCGIVGAAARRDIVPVLLEGLRRLEYRGYDSCGVAVIDGGTMRRIVSVSRVADLGARIQSEATHGSTGIAHTRWATHGAPATQNAHPLVSRDEIALVHNGIIENYEELRAELRRAGYEFAGETDTEVVAHLIHSVYRGRLVEAVRQAVKRLKGAYAIAVVATREAGRVVGARSGSPLVVGIGEREFFLASDALALAGATDRVAYLEDGDIAEVSDEGWTVQDAQGRPAAREVRKVQAGAANVELGPYRHFMQKEIFEQPRAVSDTLEGVLGIAPELFGNDARAVLERADSVLILACGTSYYAGLVARQWSKRSQGCHARSRSQANIAIATASRIRARSSSSSLNRARRPTRLLPCATRSPSASRRRSPFATSRRAA